MANLPRRNFLIRSFQWIAAAFFYKRVGTSAEFHPHYPISPPLLGSFPQIDPALDDFPLEKRHTEIAAILSQWTADLLGSPHKLHEIEKKLSPDFLGASFRPVESKLVRAGDTLNAHRITFSPEATLPSAAFLEDLRFALQNFTTMLTAELQVTRMEQDATRVRYEFVGNGEGFHCEQRVGSWEIEWRELRVHRWKSNEETRSRSSAPWFTDITAGALHGNPSYAEQLLRGVDHWRTVLDSACGIDIYGHNGISIGDVDSDGFDDLYICQPAGLPNRLYRNRGDGTFEDITEKSGVGLLDNTACALFADLNNSGRQDLVVVRASGPLLFLNEGDGTFRLKPDAFHFASAPQGTFTGAAIADYNRDGLLDIYFCLYVYYQGTDQYKYPTPYFDAQNGPPNFLMHNNGDGTFNDVTSATGLDKNNTRFSFCCGWNDFNHDGWPDLYVVNDFGRKNLYRNNGDGTFTDVAAQAGVEDVGAGMSVSWFNDLHVGDLYVANMWTAAGERISHQPEFKSHLPETVRALYRKHAMGNSLFRAKSDGGFTDATQSAGVGIGRWSWSSDVWDFDHDGFPDLYVTNGMLSGPIRDDLNSFFWRQVVAKSPEDARPSYDYEQGWNAINEWIRSDHSWSGFERNVFYANNRDGTFSDVSDAVGLGYLEDSRAFALADFDHDGRQEVFLKNRNAPQLRVLKNTVEQLPPSVVFRLRGTRSNRDAIGAAVTVGAQTKVLQAGSGFLSQHSKEVFFGLGEIKGVISASIRWPSGLIQEFHDLPINHRISIEEGVASIHVERFRQPVKTTAALQEARPLPTAVSTWLLEPVPAPTALGKPGLVTFTTNDLSSDAAAAYNLIYRYLFDRHRDFNQPTSFLLNATGEIVKVYQGSVDSRQVELDIHQIPETRSARLAKALPFPGVSATYEFGRNHLSFGSIFFQHGYFDQAQVAFSRALEDDPTSAEASYGLGSIELQRGNTHTAQAIFQKTVSLHASYPDTLANTWNNLGLIATREGRMDDAITTLQKALALNPDHFIALENLGNAHRQQKQWKEAQETLERAVAMRPQDPEVNYSIAMVYAQTDQPERAYDFLQRALKVRPTYPEALNNLGVLYLRTHHRNEAVAQFEECIRVAPEFDQSYLNLARVYSIENSPDKAREVLRDLLKRHPDHVQARQTLEQLP